MLEQDWQAGLLKGKEEFEEVVEKLSGVGAESEKITEAPGEAGEPAATSK